MYAGTILSFFFSGGLTQINCKNSQLKKKKKKRAVHKAVKSKQLCLKGAEISLSYPAVSRYCKTYGSPLGAVPKQWEMLHPICAAATGDAITRWIEDAKMSVFKLIASLVGWGKASCLCRFFLATILMCLKCLNTGTAGEFLRKLVTWIRNKNFRILDIGEKKKEKE